MKKNNEKKCLSVWVFECLSRVMAGWWGRIAAVLAVAMAAGGAQAAA